jgi:hypothetical protein
MAIEDALHEVEQSWEDIEPLLTVRELRQLAYFGSSSDDTLKPVQIFDLVSTALPPDHPAWAALDHQGGDPVGDGADGETRRHEHEVGPQVALVWARWCIRKANAALSNPEIDLEERADQLVDAATRDIVSQSIVAPVADSLHEVAVIWLQIDGQQIFPRFQFRYDGNQPIGIHDVVRQLYEQLGGPDDPLGAISWWLTPNAWLGVPPAELLGLGRDAEIDYAFQQIANDSW